LADAPDSGLSNTAVTSPIPINAPTINLIIWPF